MDAEHPYRQPADRPRMVSLRAVLLGVALTFAVGMMVTLYLSGAGGFKLANLFSIRSDDAAAPAAQNAGAEAAPNRSPATPAATPSAQASGAMAQQTLQAVERVEQAVEQAGGIDSRVAAMEQRLTRLDIQSQAAAGNAARAEGLLIAFASRRAIERGAPLGYLADQLRLRFGDARPNAVQTIIDAAQNPVTLDRLVARLEGLAPTLTDAPPDEGVFTRIGRELSSLFVVRRDDTPSPVAQRRLERARLFLDSGRTEAAVSEIRQLPNAAEAAGWIEDAERFAAAQRALETLETAAVLDPRELRDGSGDRVEQLSPAQNARAQPAR